MREIKTEIEINAPIKKVWELLTKFEKWNEWNPTVNNASGSSVLGSKLSITMRGADGKDGQKYEPLVTICNEPILFRWRAKMMAGFLFTNDRIFTLEETEKGTKLINTEAFSGLMVSLLWGKLERFVPSMLESMNKALKAKAE